MTKTTWIVRYLRKMRYLWKTTISHDSAQVLTRQRKNTTSTPVKIQQSRVFRKRLFKSLWSRSRLERFVLWAQGKQRQHFGPIAQIPELFQRRDQAYFVLENSGVKWKLPPPALYDNLLDAAAKVGAVEERIGYIFKDKIICIEALKNTRRNFPVYLDGKKYDIPRNNRLALLGDRVLSLAICEIWFKSGNSTKQYSDMEQAIITRAALNIRGRELKFDESILFSDSTFGARRNHVSETFEAILGAVYVDSGYQMQPLKDVLRKTGLDDHWLLRTPEETLLREAELLARPNSSNSSETTKHPQERNRDLSSLIEFSRAKKKGQIKSNERKNLEQRKEAIPDTKGQSVEGLANQIRSQLDGKNEAVTQPQSTSYLRSLTDIIFGRDRNHNNNPTKISSKDMSQESIQDQAGARDTQSQFRKKTVVNLSQQIQEPLSVNDDAEKLLSRTQRYTSYNEDDVPENKSEPVHPTPELPHNKKGILPVQVEPIYKTSLLEKNSELSPPAKKKAAQKASVSVQTPSESKESKSAQTPAESKTIVLVQTRPEAQASATVLSQSQKECEAQSSSETQISANTKSEAQTPKKPVTKTTVTTLAKAKRSTRQTRQERRELKEQRRVRKRERKAARKQELEKLDKSEINLWWPDLLQEGDKVLQKEDDGTLRIAAEKTSGQDETSTETIKQASKADKNIGIPGTNYQNSKHITDTVQSKEFNVAPEKVFELAIEKVLADNTQNDSYKDEQSSGKRGIVTENNNKTEDGKKNLVEVGSASKNVLSPQNDDNSLPPQKISTISSKTQQQKVQEERTKAVEAAVKQKENAELVSGEGKAVTEDINGIEQRKEQTTEVKKVKGVKTTMLEVEQEVAEDVTQRGSTPKLDPQKFPDTSEKISVVKPKLSKIALALRESSKGQMSI